MHNCEPSYFPLRLTMIIYCPSFLPSLLRYAVVSTVVAVTVAASRHRDLPCIIVYRDNVLVLTGDISNTNADMESISVGTET